MDIPKGNHNTKGTWHFGRKNNRKVIMLSCPECGSEGVMSSRFIIKPNGVVTPQAECYCGFKDFIKIIGL